MKNLTKNQSVGGILVCGFDLPSCKPSGYDAYIVTSGEYLPGRGTSASSIVRRIVHLNYHDDGVACDLRLATCTTARSETDTERLVARGTMAQLSPEHDTDLASGSVWVISCTETRHRTSTS